MQIRLVAELHKPRDNMLRCALGRQLMIAVDDLHLPYVKTELMPPLLDMIRSLLSESAYTDSRTGALCAVKHSSLLLTALPFPGSGSSPLRRLQSRLLALHVPCGFDTSPFSASDRDVLCAVCSSFMNCIRPHMNMSDELMPASRLAAGLATFILDAVDICSALPQRCMFDVHAIQTVLCRVASDVVDEQLDFVEAASALSTLQMSGRAMLDVFGMLVQTHSGRVDQIRRKQVRSS
jgi:hypothetical protein